MVWISECMFKNYPKNLNKLAEKEFNINLNKSNDHRFYIKVIQEDGHQAWSSPIYIKKV